jgi:hypothetical protein
VEISHPPAAYERSDVSLRLVGALAAGLAGTVALVILSLSLLFPETHPRAAAPEPATVPAPRLQPSPLADLVLFNARAAARLDSFDWVDRKGGWVRIPIADAMKERVRRGWAAEPRE